MCAFLDILGTPPLDDHVRYTDAPARRERLLARLDEAGYLASADVAAELGVSEMTIRRDLRRLAEEGLARRVPGGASLPGTSTADTFETRSGSATHEKRAIARAAAALLEDDLASIALDAGTTVSQIVTFLPAATSVVSHSLPVIAACTATGTREVVALGGFYEPTTRSFTGPATWKAVRELTVELAVLSCTAVDERGLYSANPADAEVKRALLEVANRVVLLVDRHKVGGRAAVRFCEPDAVDVVVTDATGAGLTALQGAYPHVLCVPTNEEA
jgi:DeoR/GlpR family transcriptional regulator of sugar metabolism